MASYASQAISLLLIGLFTRSAAVRLVVPPGPLAGGTSPVPPVRSTAALTPAGPQAPCEPAMLQRVAFLVDSLHGPSVQISDKDEEFRNSLFYADSEAVGEDMLDAAKLG
jgi:hypothetical protein